MSRWYRCKVTNLMKKLQKRLKQFMHRSDAIKERAFVFQHTGVVH